MIKQINFFNILYIYMTDNTINSFITKLEDLKRQSEILNIDVISDEKLVTFDKPFIEMSFNNIRFDVINEQISGGNNDDIKKKKKMNNNNESFFELSNSINKLIKSVSSGMRAMGIIRTKNDTFRTQYEELLTKKQIMYLKKKHGVSFIEDVYIYEQSNISIKRFGILEQKYINYVINKPITPHCDTYKIFYYLRTEIYETDMNIIFLQLVEAIKNVNNNGSILLYYLFNPIIEIQFVLYIIYMLCFKKINFIFSKWRNTYQNVVYIYLENKIVKNEQLDDLLKHNISDLYNKFIKVATINDIINDLMKYFKKIMKHIKLEIQIDELLLKAKTHKKHIYWSLYNKLIEKMKYLFMVE